MAEAIPKGPTSLRWLNRLFWALVLIAFAATAVLFAVLLRPYAGDKVDTEIAAEVAPQSSVQLPEIASAADPMAAPLPTKTPPVPVNGPSLAILITGLGTDPANSRDAIAKLPPEIGLAFSPYPAASAALAAEARSSGHEVWVAVPMQPKAWPRVSPGDNTLLVGATAAENRQRLAWALGRVGNVTGITSIMGSAFTESAAALDPVMADLRRRKLMLLDSRSSPRSIAMARAQVAGVPTLLNDRFLDENGDLPARLAALEQSARDSGSAVGLASPKTETIAALAVWAKSLDAKGLRLVAPGTLAK